MSQGDINRLRQWLEDPGAAVFLRLAESEVFRIEALALEKLLKTSGAQAAQADAVDAAKLRYVVEFFKTIQAKDYKPKTWSGRPSPLT